MDRNNPFEQLIWYYKQMNTEGRETILKIARAFVATGTFARMPELSKDAKGIMEQIERDIDRRMDEDF